MSNRIHTNLSPDQYLALTRWCIANDRSASYAVSRAISDHLHAVTQPYEGEASVKVMSRTTPENVAAVKARGGTGWRWVAACVERLVST